MVCDKVVCERWCENQHRAPPGGSVYCTFPGKLVCHTKASRGPAAATRAAAPQGSSVYCACHTKASCGPAAATRAAAPPGGSVYRACTASRGPAYCALPHDSQPRASTPPATRQPAAGQRRPRARKLCILRLPHDSQPRASGDHVRSSSSRKSVYCGCHTTASHHASSSSSRQPCCCIVVAVVAFLWLCPVNPLHDAVMMMISKSS